jgi:phosphatidate cytidylyltransferase
VGKTEVVGRSVHDGGGLPLMWWRRAASAAVLIPVFAWLAMGGPAWLFGAVVVAVSALACAELARMFQRGGRPIHTGLAVGVGAVLTASFATGLVQLALAAGVLLILSAPLWSPALPSLESTANTLFTAVYVGWLLGHAIWLQGRADGPLLVLFLVGVTWVGESAAYVFGSTIGRHPIAPVLSPRKTVEGALAQLVFSIAAGLGLGLWLVPGCSLAGAAGAGALLGVIGQAGDLAESAIKRSLGTKDAGDLIPGHGGMLDRIDGLLFNTPALYFYSLYAWCRP